MQWMNEQGTTIWINEPLDILTKRLAAGKAHRPLIKNLADTQLTSFLSQKLTERTPFYSQAKFHVNSETLAKTPLKQLLNL
jgi:shikimate kinase